MKNFKNKFILFSSLILLAPLSSCSPSKFTITWADDDGNILYKEEVGKGQIPIYNGDTPTKKSTSKYEYVFNGWEETIAPVYGNATYHCKFTEKLRKYTITWKNYDDTTIRVDTMEFGTLPTYSGEKPCRKSTAQERYIFSNWRPGINKVTGDATYKADFMVSTNTHKVTWKNYDGTILSETYTKYGGKPSYDGALPTRPASDLDNYYFAEWSPKITDNTVVDRDMAFTAQYSSTRRTATIKWINDDGSLLETDENVPYGSLPSYDGAEPSKAQISGYSYEFSGWYPSISMVMGDATYKASFKKENTKYEVQWLNYDGTILAIDKVTHGDIPSYSGTAPYHPADERYTYSFSGWDKELNPIYANTTYRAKFLSSEKTFTIKWVDYNGTILETDSNVPYGETPSFDGEEPTRKKDSQYSYSFAGWDKEIVPATKNITYKAVYNKEERKYTIKWLNYDGEILKIDSIAYGKTPTYDGEEPVKEATAEHTYNFSGWDKTIVPVTKDAVYKANFKEATRSYIVKWVNSDGTVLDSEKVEYGKTPSYKGSSPIKADDSNYRYSFAGWDRATAAVTSDQTYKAVYKTDKLYTIRFYNYDDMLLYSTRCIYGEKPAYGAETPSKPSTTTISYEFNGWSPSITYVTGNASYTATFKETTRKYTVTWKNFDGSVLRTDTCAYNTRVTYSGTTPTRNDDEQYKYTFSGWSPSISKITSDTTYVAQYSKTLYRAFVSFDLQGGSTSSDASSRYSNLSDGKDLFYDLKKEGYAFMGWSYNDVKLFDEKGNKLVSSITLSEKMLLVALFGQSHTLSLTNQTPDCGEISGAGEYASGQSVTIQAAPKEGYQFDGWRLNGTVIATTEKYSFTMPDQDYALTASFSLKSYKLTLKTNTSAGSVSLTVDGYSKSLTGGSTYVQYTSKVVVTARSQNSSYTFLGWYDADDKVISTIPVYSFTMPYNEYQLTAKWSW